MECGVYSAECRVWCEVYTVERNVKSVKVWSVECVVLCAEGGLWSVERRVSSAEQAIRSVWSAGLPHKMTTEISKMPHYNCNSSCANDAKVSCLPHRAAFDTLSNRSKCHKVPRVPCKTTWQPAWTPSKRRGFAASPIDTAKPQENQRLETRHVGTSKRAFRARLPPILTLCSFKIDVFLRVLLRTSKFGTPKSVFPARLPSIFIASLKMPRMPRNLHLDAALTMRSAKKHVTRRV